MTKLIAVDTETTGLSSWKGDAVYAIGFAFELSSGKIHTEYYQWEVDPKTRRVHISLNDYEYKEVKGILIDPKVIKVFHNAKFDLHMLQAMSIPVKGIIHDTMIAAAVCNNLEESLGLKQLAAKYLNMPATEEDILRKFVQKLRHKAREEKQLANFLQN